MQIEGHVRIEAKAPEIVFVSEAIFIPAGNGYQGGLFDNYLNPIPQAASRHGNEFSLSPPVARRIDVQALPEKQSDKPYFFIGDIYAHFGHFLLESTARLWPLLYLRPAFAGKYLYCGKKASPTLLEKPFIKDVFGSFGLGAGDFVTYRAPCRLKNVFVATPAFEIRSQAYPVFRQTMQYIGNALAGDLCKISNSNPTPLYLSKSKLVKGVSRISNEIAIEECLREKGVDIWHPETVGLADQIREISSRKYILGFVGSALHTLLFCPGDKMISGIVGGDKINANYLIIDKLCRNVSRYEVGKDVGLCVADEASPGDQSCFQRTYYATDPERVAGTLLRNMNL